MGLRQRKSLLRCQTTEGEQPKRKPSSRSQKKSLSSSRRSPANITLVSADEQLNQFLNPTYDYEAPATVTAEQPAATPSRVEVAVKTLGKLESEVIAALFPPSGEPPATLEEISKDLGMTIGEVQNIADEALRGLRGSRTGSQRISKAWN